IESVDGVSNATFSGQTLERAVFSIDEKALNNNNLSEEYVLKYISGAADYYPLGLYTFEDELRSILIYVRFSIADDLKELKIRAGEPEAPEIDDETKAKLAAMSDKEREKFEKEMEKEALEKGLPTVQLKDIADVETVS